jgi:hypothetical protein
MSKHPASENKVDICVLIQLKRKRAREAMARLIKEYDHEPPTSPDLSILLDYLSNMVPATELMLRLLSSDWDSHDVGKMYVAIFHKPYTKPDVMICLKEVLESQKYLVEPKSQPGKSQHATIAHYIPELEALFDDLRNVMQQHSFHKEGSVIKEIHLPASFSEYIRTHVNRFVTADVYLPEPTIEQQLQAEDDLQTKSSRIAEVIGKLCISRTAICLKYQSTYNIEDLL